MKQLKLISSAILLSLVTSAFAQRIYVQGNQLLVNGSPIYMNACNTPWDNWNDFGGNYNPTFWEEEFARFESYGINSTRIWFSCNGDVGIDIATDGYVSGATQDFWDDCDDLMERAENHKIYIMATIMSFDHTKNTYVKYESWRNMLASEINVQSYIDNFLVPFAERYKDNPYLFNIDLCNEMEWMNQNPEEGNIPWSQLQRYAAMTAAAIHKSASEVTVSLGSAAVKWGSDAQNIQGSLYTGNCEGNVWSDANLQAQFNDPEAYMDIWQVHYYSWINEYYGNPFEQSPADYNLNDRPCLIGEMPGRHTLMGETWITDMDTCFKSAIALGYQGHYPWTSNDAGSGDFGSLATFGAASTAFKNAHEDLVYPPLLQCNKPDLGTDLTLCGATLPIELNSQTETDTDVSYSWYKDDVLISGETAPTISVSNAGTYIVIRDSAECSRKDELVIAATLPDFNLGDDINFCTQTSATLETGISGTGITYSWQKDGTEITGAGTSSYTTFTAGTYTATISATACDSKSDEINITSSLPEVAHDTICTAGATDLAVISTDGEYEWYDAETDGTLLASGNTYSPSITTNEIYYIKDASSVNLTVGPEALNHSLTGQENAGNIGLEFTAEKAFSITSITVLPFVYSIGDVQVTLDLKDGSGTTIESYTSATVTATAAQGNTPLTDYYTLTFDPAIAVDVAGDYQLVPSGGNSLASFGGADFTAMGEAGVIAITGDTREYKADGYPGMFDIVVQSGSSCARTPVLAVIDPKAAHCGGPIDTDGDGTPDDQDGCPNDGNKTEPGRCGCGVDDASCDDTVSITLIDGWNMVSFYVEADDMSVNGIFASAQIIKTQDGFWSATQPDYLNSLQMLQAGEGYLVYNVGNETIEIHGQISSIEPTVLKEGWNLIGIPSADTILPSDYSNILFIKDFESFYEPGNASSSLQQLLPGKAYFIEK